MNEGPPFYGKYRGKVLANDDIEEEGGRLGRLLVVVPAVTGDDLLCWALPCTPYAGPQQGFVALPPIDANVWVEFEEGDPDRAIWSGCFWGEGEFPEDIVEPALMRAFKAPGVSLILNSVEEGGLLFNVGAPVSQTPLSLSLFGPVISIQFGEQCTLTLNVEGATLRSAETQLTLTPEKIGANCAASIQISAAGVQLSSETSSLAVTPENVQVQSGATDATLSGTGVEIVSGPTNLSLNASSATLTSGASLAQIGADGVTLVNGAATINLTGGSVSVNEGALVVL